MSIMNSHEEILLDTHDPVRQQEMVREKLESMSVAKSGRGLAGYLVRKGLAQDVRTANQLVSLTALFLVVFSCIASFIMLRSADTLEVEPGVELTEIKY